MEIFIDKLILSNTIFSPSIEANQLLNYSIPSILYINTIVYNPSIDVNIKNYYKEVILNTPMTLRTYLSTGV